LFKKLLTIANESFLETFAEQKTKTNSKKMKNKVSFSSILRVGY